MNQKIPISQLIEGLRNVGAYDPFTQRKLDLLISTFQGAPEISQKERLITRHIFAGIMEKIQQEGMIRFVDLGETVRGSRGPRVTCEVKQFLGLGNAGPVYAVRLGDQPLALKVYSAVELNDMMQSHGKFGLGGVLHDLEDQDNPTRLSDLGRTVLSRKPKGVYGRCNRIVKIHKVGQEGDYLFLLMDLLAVDPISKVDPAKIGGEPTDLTAWAVDCAVGLCHLHVEERRLHLNLRPEAFIRKEHKSGERLPKYTFFHYPRTFERGETSHSRTTEFIMVDHLDNSVEIADPAPRGLCTVGSWPFLPPEAILHLLQVLRADYQAYVHEKMPVRSAKTIKMKRSQMDDIWALGVTLYQFLCGGKYPFGEPKNLADMVNSVLLTKFDFTAIDGRLRDLVASMLDKDPKKRFLRILDGCPEKIQSRRVLAEAILYKLERIALDLSA